MIHIVRNRTTVLEFNVPGFTSPGFTSNPPHYDMMMLYSFQDRSNINVHKTEAFQNIINETGFNYMK